MPREIEKKPAEDTAASEADQQLTSTIHPDRFDMSRFSELQENPDEKENPWRIIIYVVVVIIIGVGLALLVRHLIQQSDSGDDNTDGDEIEQPVEEVDDVVSIETSALSDSSAVNPPASNEEFVTAETTTFGTDSSTATGVVLERFEYQNYQTFSRVALNFGDTSARSLPTINVGYTTNPTTLVLNFDESIVVADEIQETINIQDTVTTTSFDAETNTLTLNLLEGTKYRIALNNSDVFIDLRTEAQMELADQADNEATDNSNTDSETDNTTDPTTDVAPSGDNLTNAFSENKQYVTNTSVTGNTIEQDIFYYGNTAEYFEFAWGSEGNVGTQFVPNSSAQLIEEDGEVFIEIVISNLATEAFSQFSITGTALTDAGIDFSTANFERIDLISFEDGTATYRMQIKNAADFQLLSEPTLDGGTQVISIRIKD